jgi:hypothetical protein
MQVPLKHRLPHIADTKTEKVKWPTVDFAHEMATTIVKGKKKKKKNRKELPYDGAKFTEMKADDAAL